MQINDILSELKSLSQFEIKEIKDKKLYVKKAVNWALRQIGKRNVDLKQQAINMANEILKHDSRSAQWIAKDALRELKGEKANILNYPRSIYRKRKSC